MDTPSREQIIKFLAAEYQLEQQRAGEWATVLCGLPWRYIEPTVKIAVNSGNHPAIVLASASSMSADPEFVAIARAHLDRLGLINRRKRYIACGSSKEVGEWIVRRGVPAHDVIRVYGNPDKLRGLTGAFEVVRFKSHSRNPKRRQIEEQIAIVMATLEAPGA